MSINARDITRDLVVVFLAPIGRSHTTVFLKRPGCFNVATEDVPTSFRWLIAGVRLSERADVITEKPRSHPFESN
jgi:hypothetical protein